MLPHQVLTIGVPCLIGIGVVLLVVLMKWRFRLPIHITKGRDLDKVIIKYIRQHIVKTIIVTILLFTLIALPSIISNFTNKSLLNASMEHFKIVSSSTVSGERVELTRIELEKSLGKINSNAKVNLTEPIKVYLYNNTDELQQKTKAPKSVYGFTHLSDEGPIIYIAAELPKNEKPVFNEGAPIHELTHAIEMLIAERKLPRWISEGLAEQHHDFLERVLINVGIWWEREKLMNYDILTIYKNDYPKDEKEKQLFYSSSYGFVRYLFLNYGESTIWEIVHEVGNGVPYENALLKATGRSERELYEDSLKEWRYEY